MNVWIPQKSQIVNLLQDAVYKLSRAYEVKDVESELDDLLTSIQCHVINRANVEKGKIKA
uniref:Uncharacterized protein n=1 Tax=viral metagenome TaxID=1070528 RepID=A0A6M3LK99_9ZZZZ